MTGVEQRKAVLEVCIVSIALQEYLNVCLCNRRMYSCSTYDRNAHLPNRLPNISAAYFRAAEVPSSCAGGLKGPSSKIEHGWRYGTRHRVSALLPYAYAKHDDHCTDTVTRQGYVKARVQEYSCYYYLTMKTLGGVQGCHTQTCLRHCCKCEAHRSVETGCMCILC